MASNRAPVQDVTSSNPDQLDRNTESNVSTEFRNMDTQKLLQYYQSYKKNIAGYKTPADQSTIAANIRLTAAELKRRGIDPDSATAADAVSPSPAVAAPATSASVVAPSPSPSVNSSVATGNSAAGVNPMPTVVPNPAAAAGTPASAAMLQGGAGATPGMGATSTMSDPEFELLRKRVLYSPDDPDMAVMNVLSDMGLPAYNPIIRQTVLPAARGLGAAFSLQNATSGNIGQGALANLPELFKAFLMNAISGQGGAGSDVYGSLSRAASTLQSPGLAQALRDAFDVQRSGGQTQNPFLGSLLPLLSDPSALLGLQQTIGQGLMGNQLAQGQRALGELGAVRGYRTMGPEGDFLQSLFGT